MAYAVTLVVTPRIANKLLHSHAVSLEEIEECFLNRTGPLIPDARNGRRSDPESYWFIGRTNIGRELKIFFTERDRRYYVKTAYPPSEREQKMYYDQLSPSHLVAPSSERVGQVGRIADTEQKVDDPIDGTRQFVERLTQDQQFAALALLPDWMRKLQATEVSRLVVYIPIDEDLDRAAQQFLEQRPTAVQVRLVNKVLSDFDPHSLAAVGLYPSGIFRTVGSVSHTRGGSVLLEPFDYWSLIDPDIGASEDDRELKLTLNIFGIGLQ